MSKNKSSCVVIFGGLGFIGSFFAKYILAENYTNLVYLVDIQAENVFQSKYRERIIKSEPRIKILNGDVRKKINLSIKEEVKLIANFAAIHREPGHLEREYYETNIRGAENVCNWAVKMSCSLILFTSSIAPYGVSGEFKNEDSLPVPSTAYGGSKLVSEKIHQAWQSADKLGRNLIIVRPGVVFGPGEGGNVSRLIKAIKGKYFFYMGNKNTVKAGVYIKELTVAMLWVIDNQYKLKENTSIFNMTMAPAPTVSDYVKSINSVLGIKRNQFSVPYWVLLVISMMIGSLFKLFGKKSSIDPVRIKKLIRSNNIYPSYLIDRNYKFEYSLIEALRDWQKDYPEDW